MGVSMGLVIMIIGIVGCVACVAAMVFSRKQWEKQRKELLRQIEFEDR